MSATAASLADKPYRLQTDDRLVLNDLVEHLLSTLSGTIRRIVLFGSRARGDFNLSSDMDVLVVTKECDSSVLERARTARYEVMQS
jgi:predicted nucleotidyltransferase